MTVRKASVICARRMSVLKGRAIIGWSTNLIIIRPWSDVNTHDEAQAIHQDALAAATQRGSLYSVRAVQIEDARRAHNNDRTGDPSPARLGAPCRQPVREQVRQFFERGGQILFGTDVG